MLIVHHVSIASSPQIAQELAALGVDVDDSGLVAFEVDESHDDWSELKAWIGRRRPLDIVTTRFSLLELARASALELKSSWHHGRPQPEQEAGYLAATFDLREHCPRCGLGKKQIAPFQMKAEPLWGRNGLMQLDWIFDEYFVKPEVWEEVFRPFGIEGRAVKDTRGQRLETVLQLVVRDEVGIVTEGVEARPCPTCRRVKYLPVVRGPFPALTRPLSSAIAKTTESFGEGSSAYRAIVVSRDLADALQAAEIRGVAFVPVGVPESREPAA
jgi:hypothetical protein